MLYDKRWDVQTDMYSLASLIAWLEQQPAEESYCYADNGKCLLGQYFSEKSGKLVLVGSNDVCFALDKPDHWSKDVYFSRYFGLIACGRPWTFGAALARAKALAP